MEIVPVAMATEVRAAEPCELDVDKTVWMRKQGQGGAGRRECQRWWWLLHKTFKGYTLSASSLGHGGDKGPQEACQPGCGKGVTS